MKNWRQAKRLRGLVTMDTRQQFWVMCRMRPPVPGCIVHRRGGWSRLTDLKISYYSQNSRENRDMLFRVFAAIVQGHATPPPQNKYTKEKQIISQTNYCYFIFNSFWWDTFQLGVNMKHCFRKKKNPLDFQILSAYSASQSSSGITNLKIIFSERS